MIKTNNNMHETEPSKLITNISKEQVINFCNNLFLYADTNFGYIKVGDVIYFKGN